MDHLLWLDQLSWQGFAASGDQPALFRSLTWAIAPGERWAVVGPEGCGKSTLLRLMAGLLRPGSGEVWLDGQVCSARSDRAALLGVLFAEPASHFLTPVVWEEVALTPASHGVTGPVLQQQVRQAMAWVALPETLARRELATLSAAQSARVALAAALVMQPRLLLLDEPGAQLSSAGEVALAERLAALQPMTSIVFTSRMTRAERFAERILWLEEGQLRLL